MVDSTVPKQNSIEILTTELSIADLEKQLPGQPAGESLFVDNTDRPLKRELGAERPAITHQFESDYGTAFITVGLFDDGAPAELFIHLPHSDSNLNNLYQILALSISINLQQGVLISTLEAKLLPSTDALVTYVIKWLVARFEATKSNNLDTLSKPVAVEVKE